MSKKKPPKSQHAAPIAESAADGDAIPQGLRLEYRTPSELQGNPANWRRHPDEQRAAMRAALKEVGWAGALLYNEQTQRLIDGHMRLADAAPTDKLPVLIGSWSPEQEAKILATHDAIGGMAEVDVAALDRLLEDVQFNEADLQNLVDEVVLGEPDDSAGESSNDDESNGDGEGDQVAAASNGKGKRATAQVIAPSFQIVITCRDENHQKDVYAMLVKRKLACKVLS